MTFLARTFAAAALSLAFIAPAPAQSVRDEIDNAIAEYLAAHPEKVQAIVKDYLTKNPEVLAQALAELIKRKAPAAAAAPRAAEPEVPTAAVRDREQQILRSPHQVVLGNPNGKVTMVEFFDYNCGFCKRALADMQALLRDDPELRIVLKEFPILGPGSVEAAQVAVAVRMQDPAGGKYLAFHQALLQQRGMVDRKAALAAARDAGLDVDRIARDLSDPEVQVTLAETHALARELGINGTPAYVIGDKIVPGAIGVNGLKTQLLAAQ